MHAAPPGWYPDDTGTRRYWDGMRWSAEIAREARNWAVVAHLSALVAMFVALAFLGPLVVYLVRQDDPYVREHAREALNFQLSALLYGVVGGVILVILIVFLVGIFLIPVAIAAAIAWLALIVVAAMRASEGREYRYPLTIRFVN